MRALSLLIPFLLLHSAETWAMGKRPYPQAWVDVQSIQYTTTDGGPLIVSSDFVNHTQSIYFSSYGQMSGTQYNGTTSGTTANPALVALTFKISNLDQYASFDPTTQQIVEQLRDCMGMAAAASGKPGVYDMHLKFDPTSLAASFQINGGGGFGEIDITQSSNPVLELQCSM